MNHLIFIISFPYQPPLNILLPAPLQLNRFSASFRRKTQIRFGQIPEVRHEIKTVFWPDFKNTLTLAFIPEEMRGEWKIFLLQLWALYKKKVRILFGWITPKLCKKFRRNFKIPSQFFAWFLWEAIKESKFLCSSQQASYKIVTSIIGEKYSLLNAESRRDWPRRSKSNF